MVATMGAVSSLAAGERIRRRDAIVIWVGNQPVIVRAGPAGALALHQFRATEHAPRWRSAANEPDHDACRAPEPTRIRRRGGRVGSPRATTDGGVVVSGSAVPPPDDLPIAGARPEHRDPGARDRSTFLATTRSRWCSAAGATTDRDTVLAVFDGALGGSCLIAGVVARGLQPGRRRRLDDDRPPTTSSTTRPVISALRPPTSSSSASGPNRGTTRGLLMDAISIGVPVVCSDQCSPRTSSASTTWARCSRRAIRRPPPRIPGARARAVRRSGARTGPRRPSNASVARKQLVTES